MPFPIFPACPSFGFAKLSDYSNTVIEQGSGFRTTNRGWYYPLHTFSAVPVDTRRDDDIYLIQRFWHAIGGRSNSFLFKDHTDYKSTNDASSLVTSIDQPIFETTEGNFQLAKVYVDEDFLFSQVRLIQKPKQGTIVIANDGIDVDESNYSIDYDTGIVTVDSSVTPGNLTWGGEFYVLVMFETIPEFSVVNYRTQSTGFALREIRTQVPQVIIPT